MISFGIMTALLLALICTVHYDLLGLFLAHPYGQRIVYVDNEQQQYRPRFELDHMWIPRPGTDPNTLYFQPQPVIVQVNGESYWTDSIDDGGGAHSNRGTLSDDETHQQKPEPDASDNDNNYINADHDYVAPGLEWDDDVF